MNISSTNPRAQMQIRLTTLGAVRVYRGDAELADLPSQRLRFALLLFLAVERDVSREDVVAMFWPDRDLARGKHALRQMLYELRGVLGEEWIELRRDRILVRISVDATDFEAAVEENRTADALHLYGGAFLRGFTLEHRSFEGWSDRRQAHLSRLHRRVEREHIAQLAADGRLDDASNAARRWVELDPLEDEAAHTLIERLAAAGQRTAALQYYDNYVRQLASELQVEPLEETTALVAAIRQGDVVHAGLTTPAFPRAPATVADDAVAASTPSAAPSPAARARERPLWRRASRFQRAAALTVVAGVAAALLFVRFVLEPRPGVTIPADGTVRIAVLPFTDHAADGELTPLTSALTETLAHSLALSRFLDVISPNGVLLLRSEGAPEDSLGRMLGADYLVGGSVRRDGDHVRVDIELLDGRSGTVVHSEVVNRSWDESRILVEDVVREAATFLRREVGEQVEVERVRTRTSSEAAWRYVIEAKAIQASTAELARTGQFEVVQRSLDRADSVLVLAAGHDRGWAEPLVLRGWVLAARAFMSRASTPGDAAALRVILNEGLELSRLAVERDPLNAGAHELRGALLHQLALVGTQPRDSIRRGFDAAEAALRRATDLDPLSQSAWRRLAALLYADGRYAEAKFAAERAYRVDPYASEANSLVNLLFATSFEVGEDDQAEGWCLEGRRRFPNELPFLYCLFSLHAWAEDIEADPAVLRRALEIQGPQLRIQPQLMARFETMLAAAHARAGQPDSARGVLRRVGDGSGDPALLWMRAAAHAALNEDAAALALLEAYFEQRGWEAERVARTRPFSRLRGHPVLHRLMATAELP